MNNTSKIIRRADLTKNFSIIPNHIAQSTEISPNAKSLLIHILSMPNDWYYVKTQFWRKTNLGRAAFNTAWKELEELGFIKSERIIEGNLVRGYNYIISDLPIFGYTENRTNRETENPNSGQQLNTNITKKEFTKKEYKKENIKLNSNNSKADKSFEHIFRLNPNISAIDYLNGNY